MCHSLKGPEECDVGRAKQRQEQRGAKCTCQLEFQSLDITNLPLAAAAVGQSGQGQTLKIHDTAALLWGQICIIIREDWGKLLVIFCLGSQLSCKTPYKVAYFAKKMENEFLKSSSAGWWELSERDRQLDEEQCVLDVGQSSGVV